MNRLIQHQDGIFRLVVGSPKANSTHPSSPKGIKEPGAIYKCDIYSPFKECVEVLIDKRGKLINMLIMYYIQ